MADNNVRGLRRRKIAPRTTRVDEHLVRAEYKIVQLYRRLSKRVLPYDCTRPWGLGRVGVDCEAV